MFMQYRRCDDEQYSSIAFMIKKNWIKYFVVVMAS